LASSPPDDAEVRAVADRGAERDLEPRRAVRSAREREEESDDNGERNSPHAVLDLRGRHGESRAAVALRLLRKTPAAASHDHLPSWCSPHNYCQFEGANVGAVASE